MLTDEHSDERFTEYEYIPEERRGGREAHANSTAVMEWHIEIGSKRFWCLFTPMFGNAFMR